jgi:epoxyqueuosine reductase
MAAIDGLAEKIREWGREAGFQQIGIAKPDLTEAGERLRLWLERGYHAEMSWLAEHAAKRCEPALLVPGTLRVICARLDYWREDAYPAERLAGERGRAWISRYAIGRDYHKVMRPRLGRLAERIAAAVGPFGYRAFVDSGPVMEKPLAQQAGLGWIGKHTNLINHQAGSWFFLGEILTDLPLPVDAPAADHCGSCRACMEVCPTGAIVAPYVLDARRCISYLTIENKGPIPEEFRGAIGNRVFGCDDCQLHCPWNKFARHSAMDDFAPRHALDREHLVELFRWNEETWQARTAGSAIRRAGYSGWLRNLAVALGNAASTAEVVDALQARLDHGSAIVREHVRWALSRHRRAQHVAGSSGNIVSDDARSRCR